MIDACEEMGSPARAKPEQERSKSAACFQKKSVKFGLLLAKM